MIVHPTYDPETQTYFVEYAGRPEGPVPRFNNWNSAAAYARKVQAGLVETPQSPVADQEVTQQTPHAPPPRPQPQPQQPESAFKPLQVSGLGTIARGKFLNRLGYDVSPRAHGDTVLVVTESVSRLFEPTPLDLRERRRSPLVQ